MPFELLEPEEPPQDEYPDDTDIRTPKEQDDD